MRLLMLEDDVLFGCAAQKALQRAGYAVDWIKSATELSASMRSFEYDCVLLDLNLGEASGEQCLKEIRSHNPNLPLIVVSARGGLGDRVQLLEHGADDYLVKPVDLDEICARVRAVTRRGLNSRGGAASQGELTHGDLRLQPARRTATWKSKIVPLTNREFWVLEALVRKKGHVLSREKLEATLYGWGEEIDSNAIEVYIHHLRRKLNPGLIKTVRGQGYQLGPDPADA
jgi:DNA-binding response OmpR family regulator